MILEIRNKRKLLKDKMYKSATQECSIVPECRTQNKNVSIATDIRIVEGQCR